MRRERLTAFSYYAVLVAACLCLGCRRPTKHTQPIKQIQSDDHQVRNKAIQSLAKKATAEELDQLCRLLLNHSSGPIRAACARALGYIKRSAAVPALLNALEDDHWLVRRSAVDALGHIADPRACIPLVKMLSDKELEIQQHAATAFQRLKSPAAVPILITKLNFTNSNNCGDVHDMNREVLKALTYQADRRALVSVSKMLDYPFIPVARCAADALGAIVGQEFKEEVWISYGCKIPLGSPSKAKKWLEAHPQVLSSPDTKEDGT